MESSKVHPSFLEKTYDMLENEGGEYIYWSKEKPNTFVISAEGFAETVLPKYFKHNNLTSYVRSLNMYGFRKVTAGGMGTDPNLWEFTHSQFGKGKRHLLKTIRRKVPVKQAPKNEKELLIYLKNQVEDFRGLYEDSANEMKEVKDENEQLKEEVQTMRGELDRAQDQINVIMKMLSSLGKRSGLAVTGDDPLLENLITQTEHNGTVSLRTPGAHRMRTPGSESARRILSPSGLERSSLFKRRGGEVPRKALTNGAEDITPGKRMRVKPRSPKSADVSSDLMADNTVFLSPNTPPLFVQPALPAVESVPMHVEAEGASSASGSGLPQVSSQSLSFGTTPSSSSFAKTPFYSMDDPLFMPVYDPVSGAVMEGSSQYSRSSFLMESPRFLNSGPAF